MHVHVRHDEYFMVVRGRASVGLHDLRPDSPTEGVWARYELSEPDCCLTDQYRALMQTEGFTLSFDETGVRRVAEIAYRVNERSENIGARRLHTVLERLLDVVSFEAADQGGQTILVDAGYVDDHLGELVQDEDLSRYIL